MCRSLLEVTVTEEEMYQLPFFRMMEEVGKRHNWRRYYQNYQSSSPAIDVDYEVVKETTIEGGIEKVFPLQNGEKTG